MPFSLDLNMGESDSIESESDVSDIEEESSGSDLEEEDFRTRLRDCLDDVRYEGTFSAFCRFSTYVNPGLCIDNYGSVGLPLATRDAEQIALICKQSPFGKGAQTIVDTSVRKTWELDCTGFQCQNPAWTAFLDSLVKRAMEDLGVQVPSRAEQYKLLLYEEGAFFKAHKDSEKVPGMFGTLVICLPSEHTGGEVHLVHGKEKRVLETAKSSKFDLSTLAWYSNVQHEVRPIVAGYRLVLTYNLVQDQGLPRQSAAALDESHARLERLLHIWDKEFDYLDMFVYPLEHQYTEASLCLKSLKGHDAAKARYLQHLCPKNGVYWFLGRMTKETEDDYGDEIEMLSLDHIVTPGGEGIELDLDMSRDGILAEDLYEDRSADSEDEGEYTGNEGMNSTYRYHDTVLILLRKEKVISQFSSRQYQDVDSLRALFGLIRDDRAAHPSQETAKLSVNALRVILSKLVNNLSGKSRDNYGYSSYGYSSYGYSGYGFVKRDEVRGGELRELFASVSNFCDTHGQADLVRESLREAMQDGSWSSSTNLVRVVAKQVVKDTHSGAQPAWDNWLSQTLPEPTFKQVNDMQTSFGLVRLELPSSMISSFDDWMKAKLQTLLHSVKNYSQDDISAILAIIPSITPQCYFDVVLPTLVNSPSPVALARFLSQLAANASEDAGSWAVIIKPTYEHVIHAAAQTLKIPTEDFGRAPPYPGYLFQDSESPPGYLTDFLAILQKALIMHLDNEALRLLRESLPDLPGTDSSFWAHWRPIFMFSEKLVASVEERHHNSNVSATAASFIKTALQASAESLVGRRPIEPTDWKRTPQRTCTCAPCNSLNRFLVDRNQSVGRFAYAEKIRKHLRYSLDYQDYKFDTEKGKSPYTLVIRKTNNEYRRLNERWNSEISAMRSQLRRLQDDIVKSSLSKDFGELVSLDQMLQTPGSQGVQSLKPISAVAQNSRAIAAIAGVKRKAEVVDLTEDASD
ncbi:hypothetical protein K469DRAFT_675665 [Zopfia rhizophila CBS 207.26]|uniref:Prolyl 4-hydroxylase alpha subunit Fe(2+) 2OG dioxygenase domain-containing protein n=1 Tax=Zopfia rhizophila CBS 207.26 TaxID=1314779 RepID=A0A6A6DJR8_9PEZI|nr:hypothetical protein K469DRAFT_675665 [Zopfia rhizophila CBS 207.26]